MMPWQLSLLLSGSTLLVGLGGAQGDVLQRRTGEDVLLKDVSPKFNLSSTTSTLATQHYETVFDAKDRDTHTSFLKDQLPSVSNLPLISDKSSSAPPVSKTDKDVKDKLSPAFTTVPSQNTQTSTSTAKDGEVTVSSDKDESKDKIVSAPTSTSYQTFQTSIRFTKDEGTDKSSSSSTGEKDKSFPTSDQNLKDSKLTSSYPKSEGTYQPSRAPTAVSTAKFSGGDKELGSSYSDDKSTFTSSDDDKKSGHSSSSQLHSVTVTSSVNSTSVQSSLVTVPQESSLSSVELRSTFSSETRQKDKDTTTSSSPALKPSVLGSNPNTKDKDSIQGSPIPTTAASFNTSASSKTDSLHLPPIVVYSITVSITGTLNKAGISKDLTLGQSSTTLASYPLSRPSDKSEFPGYKIVPSPSRVKGEDVPSNTTDRIPVWTPELLGNAYGGGFITTPSIYVTKLPFPGGPQEGVPPGYGTLSGSKTSNVKSVLSPPSETRIINGTAVVIPAIPNKDVKDKDSKDSTDSKGDVKYITSSSQLPLVSFPNKDSKDKTPKDDKSEAGFAVSFASYSNPGMLAKDSSSPEVETASLIHLFSSLPIFSTRTRPMSAFATKMGNSTKDFVQQISISSAAVPESTMTQSTDFTVSTIKNDKFEMLPASSDVTNSTITSKAAKDSEKPQQDYPSFPNTTSTSNKDLLIKPVVLLYLSKDVPSNIKTADKLAPLTSKTDFSVVGSSAPIRPLIQYGNTAVPSSAIVQAVEIYNSTQPSSAYALYPLDVEEVGREQFSIATNPTNTVLPTSLVQSSATIQTGIALFGSMVVAASSTPSTRQNAPVSLSQEGESFPNRSFAVKVPTASGQLSLVKSTGLDSSVLQPSASSIGPLKSEIIFGKGLGDSVSSGSSESLSLAFNVILTANRASAQTSLGQSPNEVLNTFAIAIQPLTLASVATVPVSGSSLDTVSASGSSPATASVSGSLVATVSASGSSLATVFASGSLPAIVSASGLSLATVSASGLSLAIVSASGSSPATVSVSGSLVATVSASGSSPATASASGPSPTMVSAYGSSPVTVSTSELLLAAVSAPGSSFIGAARSTPTFTQMSQIIPAAATGISNFSPVKETVSEGAVPTSSASPLVFNLAAPSSLAAGQIISSVSESLLSFTVPNAASFTQTGFALYLSPPAPSGSLSFANAPGFSLIEQDSLTGGKPDTLSFEGNAKAKTEMQTLASATIPSPVATVSAVSTTSNVLIVPTGINVASVPTVLTVSALKGEVSTEAESSNVALSSGQTYIVSGTSTAQQGTVEVEINRIGSGNISPSDSEFKGASATGLSLSGAASYANVAIGIASYPSEAPTLGGILSNIGASQAPSPVAVASSVLPIPPNSLLSSGQNAAVVQGSDRITFDSVNAGQTGSNDHGSIIVALQSFNLYSGQLTSTVPLIAADSLAPVSTNPSLSVLINFKPAPTSISPQQSTAVPDVIFDSTLLGSPNTVSNISEGTGSAFEASITLGAVKGSNIAVVPGPVLPDSSVTTFQPSQATSGPTGNDSVSVRLSPTSVPFYQGKAARQSVVYNTGLLSFLISYFFV